MAQVVEQLLTKSKAEFKPQYCPPKKEEEEIYPPKTYSSALITPLYKFELCSV
jgi:hypothetical protein